MTRFLILLALLAAVLTCGVVVAARAVAPAGPVGWQTAARGLTPEAPDHALLGPISAAGRKAWDCWPELEAESATLDPVFPAQHGGPAAGASPRP
ncbi:MAG: hypothetical protein KGM44_11335 [bacterium]|nr:hypothetical protein [bacterium]